MKSKKKAKGSKQFDDFFSVASHYVDLFDWHIKIDIFNRSNE